MLSVKVCPTWAEKLVVPHLSRKIVLPYKTSVSRPKNSYLCQLFCFFWCICYLMLYLPIYWYNFSMTYTSYPHLWIYLNHVIKSNAQHIKWFGCQGTTLQKYTYTIYVGYPPGNISNGWLPHDKSPIKNHHVHHNIGVSLVMADPQVTKGFNTRSWSFMTWTFWAYATEQSSTIKRSSEVTGVPMVSSSKISVLH